MLRSKRCACEHSAAPLLASGAVHGYGPDDGLPELAAAYETLIAPTDGGRGWFARWRGVLSESAAHTASRTQKAST